MECPICLEAHSLVRLPCMHALCDGCLDNMFKNAENMQRLHIACPICTRRTTWCEIYNLDLQPLKMEVTDPLTSICIYFLRMSRQGVHYAVQKRCGEQTNTCRHVVDVGFELKHDNMENACEAMRQFYMTMKYTLKL